MSKAKAEKKKYKLQHVTHPDKLKVFQKEIAEKRAEAAKPPKPVKAVAVKTIKRDELGHWLPGQSGNLSGQPGLGKTRLDKLITAIQKVENEESRSLLVHYVREAFSDNSVLINLISKLHPSLQALALSSIEDNRMSDEEALAIQKKLKRRYESETPPLSETAT